MLGQILKKKREKLKLSVRKLDEITGIDSALINKFEKETREPTSSQLARLKSALNFSDEEFKRLQKIRFQRKSQTLEHKGGEEKIPMEDKPEKQLKVNIPKDITVQYTDSVFLTVSPYGIVLDFAQSLASTAEQNIVSRVGMSHDHAKVLVDRLNNLLNKGILKQKQVTEGASHKELIS